MKKFWFVLTFLLVMFLPTNVYAFEKRVLVIEIDPYLQSKGMRTSEFLGHKGNADKIISNLSEDIPYSSNGNVSVRIVGREYLNEFPTYTKQVTLLDGSKSNRFDEARYLSVFNNGWNGWWDGRDSEMASLDIGHGGYFFDYEYLINKFDLVNRKNKNEFNEVWLIGIDPLSAYETAMVGRTAYWINGSPIKKDCDNFIITGFTISRYDSPLECLAHASENIMRTVFTQSYNTYKSGQTVQRKDLNLWELFSAANFNVGFSQVGTVHHAPNGTIDYDWLNSNYVDSGWIDWKNNYPNLNGQTIRTNYQTWNPIGDRFYAGRYYHRWWFSLMPHVSGVTWNGFSNNWWNYLTTYDYVENVSNDNQNPTYYVGDTISNLSFNLTYHTGKQENRKIVGNENNISILDKNIVDYKNNNLVALSPGKVNIGACYDNKCVTNQITVLKKEEAKNDSQNNSQQSNEESKNEVIIYSPLIKQKSQQDGITVFELENNKKNDSNLQITYRYFKGSTSQLPSDPNWNYLNPGENEITIKGYGLFYLFVQATTTNSTNYTTSVQKVICKEEKQDENNKVSLFNSFTIENSSLKIREDKYEYIVSTKESSLIFHIDVPSDVTYKIFDNDKLLNNSYVTVVFTRDGFDYSYVFKVKKSDNNLVYIIGIIITLGLIFGLTTYKANKSSDQ